MKKILTVIIVLTAALAANAQNSWQGGIRIGVGNNILMPNNVFSGECDSANKFSLDYTVGLSAGWFPNRRTYYSHKLKGLRFEAHYSTLSQNYKSLPKTGQETFEFSSRLRAGYISIPVLFAILPSSDHGSFFEVGPQVSILVHSSEQFSTPSRDDNLDYSRTDKTGLSPVNYQMTMTYGKLFNLGNNGALSIGAKFTYSFNQVVQNRPTGNYQNFSVMLHTGFTLRGRDHYN